MASTARPSASAPPVAIPARIPTHGPSVDPTSAPTKAPDSSIPSMPMLITATRSHITPVSAPKVMGVLLITDTCSMPTRLNSLPAAAHPRKAKTNNIRPMPSTMLVALPKPRASCIPPRKASTAATV